MANNVLLLFGSTYPSNIYASKVMLKILQARLQQYMNRELPTFKLDLEKAAEPEIELPKSVGSSKKQEMPGLPVHHQLPEFTQAHVHRVGDAIQPSHPLSSHFPPACNPYQHESFPVSQLFA